MSAPGQVGTIYLIHFERRYRHAGHYTGWAANFAARIAHHRAGSGARLLAVLLEHGIDWDVVRTWTGTRSDERALKNQGGASRRCPRCGVTAVARSPKRRPKRANP